MCIMVEREEEFLPVVSISDQGNDSHVWKEAYKQFVNKSQKKLMKSINLGFVSLVSMSEDGGDENRGSFSFEYRNDKAFQ